VIAFELELVALFFLGGGVLFFFLGDFLVGFVVKRVTSFNTVTDIESNLNI